MTSATRPPASRPACEALIVYTTVGDDATAERLARGLVADRLAACVQIVRGVRSIYRWDGALHDEPEVQLAIKTSAGRYAALEASLRRDHPYAVPEIVAVPVVAGSSAYLAWMDAACGETRTETAEASTR